ncbi:unnamed protein product [Lactuca saligna]|uniref:Uncharacterized protein n=1 Tax=Lactuca saligna TaxID=75948 RepID=A0AA35YXL2_LACSI|nr:unnamed protein product [Lactuca saligna]
MLMISIFVSASGFVARGYSWNQLLLGCCLDDDGSGSGIVDLVVTGRLSLFKGYFKWRFEGVVWKNSLAIYVSILRGIEAESHCVPTERPAKAKPEITHLTLFLNISLLDEERALMFG